MKEFAKRRKTHADGESWLGKRADAHSVRKKTKKKKKKKKKQQQATSTTESKGRGSTASRTQPPIATTGAANPNAAVNRSAAAAAAAASLAGNGAVRKATVVSRSMELEAASEPRELGLGDGFAADSDDDDDEVRAWFSAESLRCRRRCCRDHAAARSRFLAPPPNCLLCFALLLIGHCCRVCRRRCRRRRLRRRGLRVASLSDGTRGRALGAR